MIPILSRCLGVFVIGPVQDSGEESQTNELLLMVIAHNIRTLIQSIIEFDVTVPGLSTATVTAINSAR